MASSHSLPFAIPAIPGSVPRSPDAAAGLAAQGSSPWLRFTWQTDKTGTAPAGSDLIRPANREEADEVLGVLLLSLSMDSGWNDSFAMVEQHLKAEVARIFNEGDPLCLVMPKGSRLIAASLLDPSPEASSHLVSGPAVLMEYRNRGIGSRLLHASLEALRGNGITVASGITRAKTMAARHVYPKFGGVAESVTFSKPVEAKS
jgi:GNAT superfamily N-acetyltransferase